MLQQSTIILITTALIVVLLIAIAMPCNKKGKFTPFRRNAGDINLLPPPVDGVAKWPSQWPNMPQSGMQTLAEMDEKHKDDYPWTFPRKFAHLGRPYINPRDPTKWSAQNFPPGSQNSTETQVLDAINAEPFVDRTQSFGEFFNETAESFIDKHAMAAVGAGVDNKSATTLNWQDYIDTLQRTYTTVSTLPAEQQNRYGSLPPRHSLRQLGPHKYFELNPEMNWPADQARLELESSYVWPAQVWDTYVKPYPADYIKPTKETKLSYFGFGRWGERGWN